MSTLTQLKQNISLKYKIKQNKINTNYDFFCVYDNLNISSCCDPLDDMYCM